MLACYLIQEVKGHINQRLWPKSLNLTLGEKSKITLVTFGSKKPQLVDTPSTVLNRKLRDRAFVKLTANVFPTITGEMQRRPLNKRFCKTGNICGETTYLLMLYPPN